MQALSIKKMLPKSLLVLSAMILMVVVTGHIVQGDPALATESGDCDSKDCLLTATAGSVDGAETCPGSVPGDVGAPQITSAVSILHPDNSLIFDFTVEVDRPSQVWVKYRASNGRGDLLTTASSANLATNHELQVMRLRADTEYCYQVFARDRDKGQLRVSDSFPGSLVTGPLPTGLIGASFRRTLGQQTYDLTLLDHEKDPDFYGFIAIDRNAEIVWYYQHTTGVGPVDQKDNYNLVIREKGGVKALEIAPDGTLVDEVLDTLEDGTLCEPYGRWHHQHYVNQGNLVYLLGHEIQDVEIDGEARPQDGDNILIWDQNVGAATEVFSLFDVLDPVTDRGDWSDIQASWHGCDGNEPADDWTHSNSLWVTAEGNTLMSIRHLDQIIAIKPDFSGLVWRLGGPGSSFSFPDPTDQFYKQHDASEVLSNGNILLFDNGNTRPVEEGEPEPYSRALELELDFATMEARKVWEYRHSPDLFIGCCGNAARLDNGNTMILFGTEVCRCGRFTLVEADAAGEAISIIEDSTTGRRSFQLSAHPLDSINGESRLR